MDGASLFQAFYSQFITRDFFAKIVPGAIVLAAILFCNNLLDDDFFSTIVNLSFGISMFMFGVCWLIGIGLQGSGSLVKAIFVRPFARRIGLQKEHSIYDEIYRDFRMASDTIYAQKYVERKVVIQEASMISLYAIITSSIMIGLSKIDFNYSMAFLIIQLCIGYMYMYYENRKTAKMLIESWNSLPRERRIINQPSKQYIS
jgi:hypothetical protein